MHIERQRQREVDRNYVFNIDKLGRNWPRGYEVEGKFRGKGPEIEYIKIPYQIDGSNLIEGHGVWVLKNNGRWISSQEDK